SAGRRYADRPAGIGLGAGVWTRDETRAYKVSGIGRENHLMMLDHYSQKKNLLVSYSAKQLGLF
uniref:hypothetical protein n=1 Tax=Mycobacterium sp. TaxID=1785 RepID=UPI003F9E6675